jgi:hypothetical protein
MTSITLDYILFIKQYIVLQTFNRWKTPQDGKPVLQVWDEIFNDLHTPLQYLYQLIYHSHEITDVTYTLADMHEIVTNMYNAPKTYPDKNFQEYVDEKINLQTICPYDYQNFIKNMTDTEFKKNLHAKYQKDHELTALKNMIIDETMELFRNNSSFECLNIIPYLEYKQQSTKQINNSITQNYFENLEQQTHEMIDMFTSK